MDGAIARYEGDRLVVRASAIGGCLKALVAGACAEPESPVPSWMAQRFAESAAAEQKIIDAWVERTGAVKVDVPFVDNMWMEGGQWATRLVCRDGDVLGHVDGLFTLPDATHVGIEVKALSSGLFDDITGGGVGHVDAGSFDGKFFRRYLWQVSAYSHALGVPWMMVVGEKLDGEYVDGVSRLAWFDVKDLVRVDDLDARVSEVARWVLLRADDDVWPDGCDMSSACPYGHLHVVDWTGDGLSDEEAADRDMLVDAGRLWDEGSELEAEGKGLKRRAREIVDAVMGLRNLGRVEVPGWRVAYSKHRVEDFVVKAHERVTVRFTKREGKE